MKAHRFGFIMLGVGLFVGFLASQLFFNPSKKVLAGDDRYKDYILCTGRVVVRPGLDTDGVWLLDYRSGKLLGTVIDRTKGKIIGWAEVDLVKEFGIQPRQDVHFMMTTGFITGNQAALYLAETSTGKLGVYTMGARPDGPTGFAIRRHDMLFFRQPKQAG